MKTKIKSYGGEATDFHDDEMLKPGSDHACLAVIDWFWSLKRWKLLTTSVFKRIQLQWKRKVIRHITQDLKISSDLDKE